MKITSSSNPLIQEIKGLYRKKNRMEDGLFIVEGIKILEEALEDNYDLESIIYTESLSRIRNGEALLRRIKSLDISREVSDRVFREISDTQTPQGVLGVAKLNLRDIGGMKSESKNTLLFLDGLQDPGNMGTIIRTADAFNIDGIIIKSGTVDPYNPKVIRATMGSIFRVPIYYMNDLDEIEDLKKSGFKLMTTSLEDARDIRSVDFDKSIIVIGNESAGVSEEIYELSDEYIKIIMPGESESLNAGVAASIIMYEVSK